MKPDLEKLLEINRPALRHGERDSLWSCIEERITPPQVRSPYTVWIRTHVTAIVMTSLFLLLIGGSTTTALAQKSRPGDTLFPIERALERLEIKLARSEEKRTALSVEHAEERISELKELMVTSQSRTAVAATSTSDAHVSAAVEALVHVVTESKMSTRDRERVFEELFEEIDPLSIRVRVNASTNSSPARDRVEIDRGDKGESRIEIRDTERRTRIERKEGKVRIEYDAPDDDRRGKRNND